MFFSPRPYFASQDQPVFSKSLGEFGYVSGDTRPASREFTDLAFLNEDLLLVSINQGAGSSLCQPSDVPDSNVILIDLRAKAVNQFKMAVLKRRRSVVAADEQSFRRRKCTRDSNM